MKAQTKELQKEYTGDNRFTLKMLYNDEPIVTTDYNGVKHEAKRDIFKFPLYEPLQLGNNMLNEPKYIQDDNNRPHIFEEGIFENSWQSVEMGEAIIDIFRLAMRIGTEDFMEKQRTDINQTSKSKIVDRKNTFSLVLYDTQSLKRDENGKLFDVESLIKSNAKLKEKELFNKITDEEKRELKFQESRLKSMYVTREIFRCDFCADEYSYDGKTFTPPLNKIWKDFSVLDLKWNDLDEKQKKEKKENSTSLKHEYDNLLIPSYKEYLRVVNAIEKMKQKRAILVEHLTSLEGSHDNIKIADLEKSKSKIEKQIYKWENMPFKGIRSTIKEYLNIDSKEFVNRFTTPRPKSNHSSAFTCEHEIQKVSYYQN